MPRRLQRYQSDAVEVVFDPNLCIHSAVCLSRLPRVFDVRRRRWVAPEAAAADDIAATIERCPSGALQFRRLDGGPAEVPDDPARVYTQTGGPNLIRGDITVLDGGGEVIARGPRFALCRCGASANKPFCDNSHRAIGFQG